MLFLLDANVLIDANRDYYPMDRVPEFWEWLVYMGSQDSVKIPIEVMEELTEGKKDELTKWAKDSHNKSNLLLNEEAEPYLVAKAINDGYANDLTDDEVEKIGRDPFLIAYSLANSNKRCLVTTEISKPKKE